MAVGSKTGKRSEEELTHCGFLGRRRVCDDIMSADGLRVLVQTTRSTQGHSHMQKLCLHAFSLISDTYGMVTTGGETEVLQVYVGSHLS
jgi:hypothetical protein